MLGPAFRVVEVLAAITPDSGVKLADGFLEILAVLLEKVHVNVNEMDLQLGPVMALISGPTVNDAISDGNNAISKLAKSDIQDEALVNELYLRILNRPAAPQEVEASLKLLASLKAEHDSLLTGFNQLKKKLEPEIASKEKARQDGIDAANTALEAYKANC